MFQNHCHWKLFKSHHKRGSILLQAAEIRRRETLRMVEETVRQETIERKSKDNDPAGKLPSKVE